MGLVSKLKNILFEEEEVEIPVLEKKEENNEKVVEQAPKKEENLVTNYSFYDENKREEKPKNIEPLKEEHSLKENYENDNNINNNAYNINNKIDIKSEKTFNFPSFDEEEFEEVIPRRSTNILEHERRKVKERFPEKSAVKAPTPAPEAAKPKFKPSPIISPVYGILDKNYTPDEITTREPDKTLDVDSVRKKAFGSLEEKIDMPIDIKNFEENFANETNEKNIIEEKLEKARTIDELLKDSSDEVINVSEEKNDFLPNLDNLEDTITDLRMQIKSNTNETLNESLEKKQIPEETIKEESPSKDDNLESDLFDLIDSMYENREDGE